MTQAQKKINVGISLLILFILTFVSGILLHLKKHGIIIEPRPVLKVVHWVSGLLMSCLVCWHAAQFWKMFVNMKKRFRWFRADTIGVIVFTAGALLTGLVKLLSPVRIPHLGLWHYYLGMIMGALILIHLVRGIPALGRLFKIRK